MENALKLGGHCFWSPIPLHSCDPNRYIVLYEGIANRIVGQVGDNLQNIYSLITDDITFAITKKGQKAACGYELIITDHPELFIMNGRQADHFSKKAPISAKNIDLLAFVNFKFVYERDTSGQK